MSVQELHAILGAGGPPGPDFTDEPLKARADFNTMLGVLPKPEDLTVEERNIGGVPGLWVATPGDDPTRVVLYLHGGAYVGGTPEGYLGLSSGVARAAGAPHFSVDYRLAPEHVYPAAVEDALAAYRGLLDAGYGPARIGIAGDSAGGGLAAALLVAIRDAGLPQPAAAVLFSPWTDLTCSSESMTDRAELDPLLTQAGLANTARIYLDGASATEPTASALHADLQGLAPVRIHVGENEVLHDDAVNFAAKATEAGVDAEARVWPGMVHDWSLFWFGLTEARECLEAAGQFIREKQEGA